MAALPKIFGLSRRSTRAAPKPKKAAGGSTKPKTKTKGVKRAVAGTAVTGGILGGITDFFEGLLESILGSGDSSGGGLGGAGGSSTQGKGFAAYRPLPATVVRTKQFKRYSNPTLATISIQMTQLLQEMGLIEGALLEQLNLQKFSYNEQARVAREVNMESGAGFVPFTGLGGALGSASLGQLEASYKRFIDALDEATEALEDMEGGGFPPIIPVPLGIPGAPAAGKPVKGKGRPGSIIPYDRVKKAEALRPDGSLKPGYESGVDKKGRVYYRRQRGGLGALKRSAPGQFVGDVTRRMDRAASRITKPITSSGAYQTAVRVGKTAVTKIKSFASTISGLARWAWDAVDDAFSKMTGRVKEIFTKYIVKDKNFNKVLNKLRTTGITKLSVKIAKIAYIVWLIWDYIKQLYQVKKDSPKLSYRQISDRVSQILSDMVAQLGVASVAFAVGTFVGGALGSVVPGAGTVVGAIIGGLAGISVGLLLDMTAEAIGLTGAIGDLIQPYVKKVVDFIVDKYAKVINKDAAGINAPGPNAQAGLSKTDTTGKGTVPYKKPPALKKVPVESTGILDKNKQQAGTVSDLVEGAAQKAGISPELLNIIASENPSYDPRKSIQSATGNQLFKLTPSQWSSVTSQYGNKFPELYAGITDPKASALAAALLIKDGQEFLTKNDIEATPATIYGSYLLGNEGIKRLLQAPTNQSAAAILPETAAARPELFQDMSGSDVTVGDLFQKLYNKSLPVRTADFQSQPPVVPQAQVPVGWERMSPSPEGQSGAAPVTGETPFPPSAEIPQGDAKQVSSPPAAITSSGATPTAEQPTGSMTGSETQPVPPSITAPAAAPVPTPPITSGSMVEQKSQELEKTEMGVQQPSVAVVNTGNRQPLILPSTSVGRAGTGNVPPPFYNMSSFEHMYMYHDSPVAENLSQMSGWS